MSALNWLRSGRPPSGTARRRPRDGRHALVLAVLAVVGAGQTGCRSDPCKPSCRSGCGGMATMTSWWNNRSFHPFHRNKGCSTCTPGEAPMVEYGAPVVTPAPGAVAVPGPAVITPGPSSVVPPATGAEPSNLQPLERTPSAAPGGPANDTGARNSTGKVNYEAYRFNSRRPRARAETLARGDVPVLEPAPAPPATALARSAAAAGANPLDNLPPVDIPSMDDAPEGRARPSPPPAPAARRDNPPSAVPAPAETRSEAASAASAQSAPNIPPGIARFAVVDTKIAGGSLPSAAGLDWLVEKGYRTVLDLRDPGEVQSGSIALVTNHGLRYLALPITDKTLDADHVARFQQELALADARPLYFCDTDGSRAGALWYIRRLTHDKIDPQLARREAEQLGLNNPVLWRAASRYLDTLQKHDRAAADAPQAAASAPEPAVPAAEYRPEPSRDGPPAPVADDTLAAAGPEPSDQDPTAWGSCAALTVAGLGIPLAYWSASSLPSFRGWTRASLPAPAPRPKSLPSA